MIVTRITHKPIHKPMWDVHTNENVFPGLTMWDVHKNGNIFLGLIVCDIHTYGIFSGFTVWNVHTYGNVFWDSPYGMYIPTKMIGFPWVTRSHTNSFRVPGGPIPDGFCVMWEGPPNRPHSLDDGSKCRRRKGFKTFV